MSRFTTRSTTLAILILLVFLGGLTGIHRVAASGDDALPRLNETVLVSPAAQAVVAADFYNVSRVRACASGGSACDFGLISAFCDSGDELVGHFAWRQNADGSPATNLVNKAVGNNPVRGVQADMGFVPDTQRAILRLVCADTST